MKLKITVDSKTYEVDVEVAEEESRPGPGYPHYAPRAPVNLGAAPPPPAAAAKPAGGVAVADENKVVRSPVAGLVVRVNTHVGQHIEQNDPVMVLEAMKMETNVTSPVTGTVKAVHAAQGDAVQVGHVLVEFE